MCDSKKTQKTSGIIFTDMEIIFLKECVHEGYYHSEIDDAEQLAISILKKLEEA